MKRHGQSEQYVPRRKKTKREGAGTTCTIKDAKVTNCKLLSIEEIQIVLKDTCGFNDNPDDDNECCSDGILLCQHHYNKVYRAVPSNQERMQHKKCSVCLSPMSNMEPRYCNKPDLVKLHLKETHNLDLDLTEHSVICRSCYRFYSKIINNPMSIDSNLQDLIGSMQRDEQAIVLKGLDSCVQYSLTCTTIKIAQSLLRNEASLLSDAYKELMTTLEQTIQKTLPCSTVNPTSLVTKHHFH